MRLVLRLTIAMTLGMCAVFAADRYVAVRQSAAMFEADAKSDQRTLGRALVLAATSVWQMHGEDAALRFVEDANQREAKTQIRWLRLDPGPSAEPDAPDPAILAQLRAGQEVTLFARDHDEFSRLDTYLPVLVGGTPMGAIELAESLAEERAFLRSRVRRAFVAGALMVIVSSLFAMVMGVQFVGRPIRSLMEKARRIGAGDFSVPLRLRQRDELSELANTMNSMADRLSQAHERVESETRERIAALEQLRHAERLSTVGRLASGIAHELGTPLNVISGRAKMIESGEVAGTQIVSNVRIIGEQVERMASIIRQLLDLARRRTPLRARVDMRIVLRDTLELLKPLASQADVELDLMQDKDSADTNVEVDVEQMRQVVANLVMNAIQASPRGGRVEVDIARTVPEPGNGSRPYFRLEVRDQGAGIPPDVLPHVFEPFFTTKGVGEGTGLGLSVTHGIIDDHGGWIDVRSDPGRGTVFCVFLPA
jgi:signal transduction histidine kinase